MVEPLVANLADAIVTLPSKPPDSERTQTLSSTNITPLLGIAIFEAIFEVLRAEE